MPSLKADFNELVERIHQGREFQHASFEPIYYLIFHPEEILTVKRQTKAWIQRLEKEGWNVHTFSISQHVSEILQSVSPTVRKIWLEAERKSPLDWEKTNKSLATALSNPNKGLQTRLEDLLNSLEGDEKALVLVTDLEALHPYMRIGAIEAELQGKFHVPTVFLYPGVRTGKTRLKFLGFYPEDGNYRSMHVGG